MEERNDSAAPTIARNVFLLGEVESLQAAFAQAGVQVIFLKGVAMILREVAGIGERDMTDIDILVRGGQRVLADGILKGLGYSREGQRDYAKVSGAGAAFDSYVDLHDGLWHGAEALIWQQAAWVACGRGQVLTLRLEAMAVHCMAHSLLSRGCLDERARRDLRMIFWHRDFDWEKFCAHVRSLSLESMAKAVALELCRDGLAIPVPALSRLSPSGMGRLSFVIFRRGCAPRPNPALEYLLPLLVDPGLARRSFFPGRQELLLRYGTASPLSLLRRQAALLGRFFEKLLTPSENPSHPS
jgi:hypothetical protein